MEEQLNLDVNTTDSSTVDTTESMDAQAAEPLNTEQSAATTDGKGPVPYNRFQEKVHEYNTLKEQYEEFNEKFGDLKAYDSESLKAMANFNKLLSESPELYQQIEQVMSNYQNGTVNLDPTEAKIKQLENQIEQMRSTVTKGVEDKVMQDYDSEFGKMVEKEFNTPAAKALAGHLTEVAMNMMNPKYRTSYSKDTLAKAYSKAKVTLDNFKNEILSSVAQTQKNINAPIAPSGVNGSANVDLLNPSARLNFAKEELEKIFQGN